MKRTRSAIRYVFLIAAGVLTLIPIAYVLLSSFKTNQELISGGSLLPRTWTFDNFREVWQELNFSRYFYNSVVFSVIGAGAVALMGAMAGYVFARTDFPGKRLLTAAVLAVMFISLGPMTLYPRLELAVEWGLNRHIYTMPIVGIYGIGASLFLYEGFVRSLGKEIDEAAVMDGAGYFRRFWRIAFPLMTPITTTFFLLEFIQEWNNYVFPLVLSSGNPELKTLTVGVVEMRNMGDGAAAWNLLMAGSAISIVPVLVLFLLLNRKIVEGLAQGAVKG
ncbi:ABC transporter permease subunit [Cohnella sp. CFH 77786]|uniref:carbohydrate ABC transporter permease n=1 Tax=Cohnella sp. CFH 77786 TaxID=2662265 RepID=UPI001C60EEA4|nr:carbohydrate ABC transporter permease [Cohnella sp. CFH 77786]MBW5448556.1 ABC transporter permease subunit [Cohnella sp. CFH 77786]